MRLNNSLMMLTCWHEMKVQPEPDYSEALTKVLAYMNEKVTLQQMADFSKEKNYLHVY